MGKEHTFTLVTEEMSGIDEKHVSTVTYGPTTTERMVAYLKQVIEDAEREEED